MLSTHCHMPGHHSAPARQPHHPHKRLAATAAVVHHAATTSTRISSSTASKAPAVEAPTAAAPASPDGQHAPTAAAPQQQQGIKFSKRQLLTFSCACCLSLQAQQRLPAAGDSGHFSYEGEQGVPAWLANCGTTAVGLAVMFLLTSAWWSHISVSCTALTAEFGSVHGSPPGMITRSACACMSRC